ncbi:hypothetical protein EG328_010686 [Venturia inaequalis]|uniref:AA1-like domain-containing protein n=1 Tax=Venturia inaequalis TaxID=5025 RepID=A0A8H3V7R3_VENIN|nr:hypothetical protein EG327_008925 [Venturia inaequalis]KAE9982693.1 hypothetical protein EG328_010686 [Venturia inaequalis]RDI84387.1 hypothetical protein Vi05172_g5641 [Venturia inaequalis]
MLIHLLQSLPLLLTTLTLASPTQQLPPPDPYDTLPWLLTDIIIIESQLSTGGPNFIHFTIQDPNPGLILTTTCSRFAPQNTDLVSNIHYPCSNRSMGFSYRGDEIWVHRSWMNNDTLGHMTSCVGYASTRFIVYPLDAGVMKRQDHMEVACTMQSGRKMD